MIIAEISTAPVDQGIHLHDYVKAALRTLDESGLNYLVCPMGTCIEAPDTETLFTVMKKMHDTLADMGCQRIVTTIKIDDRRDKDRRMMDKLEAVKIK